jgi:DNA (cytosine-5)-methyltransferase 1
MHKFVEINTKFDPQVLSELEKQTSEFKFSKAELIKISLYAVSEIGFKNLRVNQKVESESAFKFIDLFAGIGGNRIAFESVDGECVFTSEYDKWSALTYFYNFLDLPHGDITSINENDIPDHDLLLAGFPCQPFSIAGVSKKKSLGRKHGFDDKTQGTLFFDIKRILREKAPKSFLLENVKNLRSHDKKNTYKTIMEELQAADYWVFDEILDGKYYVPQHRERIFFIGFHKDYYKTKPDFHFPNPPSNIPKMSSILEKRVDRKYTLTDGTWAALQRHSKNSKAKGNGFGFGYADPNGISRTLSARYYKDGAEILIKRTKGNPRRLTPIECQRLMGFPEEFKIPVSDNQAYRQFGNSVVVPLLKDIAKNISEFI